MTIMDRSVLYQINSLEKPQKISGFLKEKGYSRQNLVDLRKNEQAICLNGTYVHMNHMLAEGDVGKLTFQGTRYLNFERC